MTKIFQIDLKILSSKLRLFKKILESHFIVLTIFKNLLQFLYAYIHLLSYRVIITYLILTSLRQAIINHLCLKQSMAQVEKPVTSNTETQFLFYPLLSTGREHLTAQTHNWCGPPHHLENVANHLKFQWASWNLIHC